MTATTAANFLGNQDDDYHLGGDGDDTDLSLLIHYICKIIRNGNVVCPFDNSTEKVLEVGCGYGNWLMEMATDFPKCQFFGIDNELKSPEMVYPKNCHFIKLERGEQGYLDSGLPFDDCTFDVVRITFTHGTPSQISTLLGEVARVTKTKGWVEFIEAKDSPNSLGPLLSKLISIYMEKSNNAITTDMVKMLDDNGFTNIVSSKIPVPLGNWVGNMVGDFSLAALKLFITNHADIHSEEEAQNFIELVEKECEQFKPSLDIHSGFAQKL